MADDRANTERQRAVERLSIALELFDWGVAIKRASLRRLHPEASSEERERLLERWLASRPGAEHGDAVGRPVGWPRHRQ